MHGKTTIKKYKILIFQEIQDKNVMYTVTICRGLLTFVAVEEQ
jgi:hypothetical protein